MTEYGSIHAIVVYTLLVLILTSLQQAPKDVVLTAECRD